MSFSHFEVANRWIRGMKATGCNMFTDGTTIWSYGKHFPIAHKMPGGVILYNDDKYSVSTSKHQSEVRGHMYGSQVDKQIYECTTTEILRAINSPEKPIILTKYEKPRDLNHALMLLREVVKKSGVKRFPTKKYQNELGRMMFLANL
jgi:hypothetical protein